MLSSADGLGPARAAWTRWSPGLALALIYLLAAAAGFNGFYQKHGLQDDSKHISAEMMLNGSAMRPFIYRQLDPWVAEFVATLTPKDIQQKIYIHYTNGGVSGLGPNAAMSKGVRFYIEYNALYYITFGEFLASIFVLRALFLNFVGRMAATVTPAILALLMPVVQATPGGLYYDFGELLFISAAALAAVRGRIGLLVLFTTLGSLNKESFFFFIPSLAPFLHDKLKSFRAAIFIVILLTSISGAIYLALKAKYGANFGQDVDVYLLDNVRFYLDPRNLFRFEKPYGLFLPRPYSLFWLSCAAAVGLAGWRRADLGIRRHAAIMFAINLPLALLFCASGEMRDFDLCLVGFGALMAYAVDAAIANDIRAEAEAQVLRFAGPGRRTA
jgi:hypothetical protein